MTLVIKLNSYSHVRCTVYPEGFPDSGSYDKPLIYFDNGATTQKPRCVVEKIESGYYNVNANIHRGVHFLSQAATEAHEDARKTVQQFLNARSSNEIIFTRGATEAINLIAIPISFPGRYRLPVKGSR